MADSTLDPENIPEPDRQLGKGHGTEALGPSDTSDSGSDMVGIGLGVEDDELAGLDGGTTSDPDGNPFRTAGPDLGDANLDSDTDSGGTGERASAGRDTRVEAGRDIGTDRIERFDMGQDDPEDRVQAPRKPPSP